MHAARPPAAPARPYLPWETSAGAVEVSVDNHARRALHQQLLAVPRRSDDRGGDVAPGSPASPPSRLGLCAGLPRPDRRSPVGVSLSVHSRSDVSGILPGAAVLRPVVSNGARARS